MVSGPGIRVGGLGFGFRGSGCRVQGSGFRVQGKRDRVDAHDEKGHEALNLSAHLMVKLRERSRRARENGAMF